MEVSHRIEIWRDADLPDDLRAEISSVLDRVDWGRSDEGAATFTWAACEWRVVVFVDGRVASHVGVLRRTIRAGDQLTVVGGVGGVATAPEMQGSGLASVAIERAVSFICESLHADFGALLCRQRLVPFYRKLGWTRIDSDVISESWPGKVGPPPGIVMFIRPCGGRRLPEGSIDLLGLGW